jgi:DNA-directed RNA polymerase specialized sigma24 family protein
MDYNKLLEICKKIDKAEPNDLLHDTWIKLKGVKVTKDFNALFYVTARNIYIERLRNNRELILLDNETQPTQYQMALDSYLEKNKGKIFADVVEIYLICPNVCEIARLMNESRAKIRNLIKEAFDGIEHEYVLITNRNSDNP